MSTFIYKPRPGEEISVGSHDKGAYLTACAGTHGFVASVSVLAAEVPFAARQIAEAMHEAAGLPAPVILERPETDPEAAKRVSSFTVSLDRSGSVSVRLGNSSVALAPPVARLLASVIAAYADAAEAGEPDPAEVGELADEIASALPDHTRPREAFELAARAVLRAGWKRERGHG